MEWFDVVDQDGNPTGELVERSEAHRKGIWHRTSHVWIFRDRGGKVEILLQKRCKIKDSFPGCYDISSAGHVPAGDGYEESAVRELSEELGVVAAQEQLIPCEVRRLSWDDEFYGIEYHDRQVTKIFLLQLRDMEEEDFILQESEVESVRWMEFEECVEAVRTNHIKHCIDMDELMMVKRGISRKYTKEEM